MNGHGWVHGTNPQGGPEQTFLVLGLQRARGRRVLVCLRTSLTQRVWSLVQRLARMQQ